MSNATITAQSMGTMDMVRVASKGQGFYREFYLNRISGETFTVTRERDGQGHILERLDVPRSVYTAALAAATARRQADDMLAGLVYPTVKAENRTRCPGLSA